LDTISRKRSSSSKATDYLLPWIVFLSPLLIFSYRLPGAIALAVTSAVLLPALLKGFVFNRSWPTRLLILTFLLSSLSSLYVTAFPQITSEQLILFALSLSIYISLCSVPRGLNNLLLWTGILLFAVLGLAIAGPFVTEFAAKDRFFKIPWEKLSPVRFPEVMDANHLASVLAMALPIVLGLLLRCKTIFSERWQRVTIWGSMVAMLTTLVIIESRAGYLAALVGIASILGFYYRKVLFVYPVGIMFSVFLLFYLGPAAILDFLFGSSAVGTWESRKELWSRALYMIQDFAFTGIGTGTFGKVAPVLYPFFINSPDKEALHAHSLYLQVAVDFGMPGLVAFIGLFSASFFLGWRAYRILASSGNQLGSTLCAGYLCGLLAWGFHGFFDSPLWLVKLSPLPFFYMGMLCSLYQIGKADVDP